MEKVRGTRRVKKRRKDSQGNSVEYSTDESFSDGERSVGQDKLDNIKKKLKDIAREENKNRRGQGSTISAKVKMNNGQGYETFTGVGDFNQEMARALNDNRGKFVHTSKNGVKRRVGSSSKDGDSCFSNVNGDYYIDPKTGKRRKYFDSAWSPTRNERNKLNFALNSVPHGENCGKNCIHLVRANMYKKKMTRRLLPMNTNNLDKFGTNLNMMG